MAAKEYAGLVGAKFLERFTVVFDTPGRRILLTPNGKYRSPAEYDESGLRIRAERPGFHRFVVKRVMPGSPAVEAGIEPGDVIESLDNHSAQDMTLTQLRNLLSRPKARYLVTVARGSNRLQVTLQLRPLL